MQNRKLTQTIFRLAVGVVLVASPFRLAADEIADLKKWLAADAGERGAIEDLQFALRPISKTQAKQALELLWADYQERTRKAHQAEWKAKKIKLGELEMKFDFRVFGDKPEGGRSLFISMHGGGGAPARVNDQQWRNQIRLYEPKEGVYLAPRAPTNTWNLWHQSHIDSFFTRIISDAILFEDVDPNKIYLMGYSAGGDGVYQLAPRMADQLAAASMMAGHPNDAQPLGLRNIGFALYMGGKDSAYNRNKKAEQWKKMLADLKAEDSEGYEHEVVIYPEFGHWMQRKDAVAVPWMAKFTRNPFPTKVAWRQSGTTHDRFYWLAVDKDNKKGGSIAVVSRDGQSFKIEKSEKIDQLVIRLNDSMIDFEKPVTVSVGSTQKEFSIKRNIAVMAKTLEDRGDPHSVYSAEIHVNIPQK